jgi:hypothetical protein
MVRSVWILECVRSSKNAQKIDRPVAMPDASRTLGIPWRPVDLFDMGI